MDRAATVAAGRGGAGGGGGGGGDEDCAELGDDGDVVEGLEPIFLAPGAVHWRSHYEWFRWFASGDVVLLMLLLAVGQLS